MSHDQPGALGILVGTHSVWRGIAVVLESKNGTERLRARIRAIPADCFGVLE